MGGKLAMDWMSSIMNKTWNDSYNMRGKKQNDLICFEPHIGFGASICESMHIQNWQWIGCAPLWTKSGKILSVMRGKNRMVWSVLNRILVLELQYSNQCISKIWFFVPFDHLIFLIFATFSFDIVYLLTYRYTKDPIQFVFMHIKSDQIQIWSALTWSEADPQIFIRFPWSLADLFAIP